MTETPGTALSRRTVLALGAAAGAGIALAGCGDSSGSGSSKGGSSYTGPKVELAFWNGFTGGDGPFMRKLTEQFSKEHPKIQVKMTAMQWADFFQKVPAAIAAGKGPDVGIMHIDDLATNAARNIILPLDDVASALKLTKADFADVVWDGGIYNNKRYGIPLDMHPLGLYYNKSLLAKAGLDPDKPPQTGDDYLAALEALKGKGVPGHWISPFPFTGTFQFEVLLWQNGGELYNDDVTEAAYNSDAGVEALTWLVDLVKKGYSPKNVAQDADVVAFQNNKNAFNWNGIWQINNFGQTKGLEWGVAPLPKIGTQNAAWAGSHQFVVLRQRKVDQNKIEAAKVFINWISQHSIEWAKGGQVPARRAVRESAEFKALSQQAEFAKEVDYLKFLPAKPGIGDAMATVDTAFNQAILGKKDPKTALDEAAAKAKKILADNAKKYRS